MIENSHINNDPFTTNEESSNNVTSNIATFIADAGVSSSGGSLTHSSYIASPSMTILSISDYLSRPKLMYSGVITDYISSPAVYDFAYDFLSKPDIRDKLKYIHLLRGTFQVKLIVTSGPYNTGRIGMSSMYGTIGEYGAVVLDTPLLVANLQHKTNTVLDLGSTNSCVLSIPLHQKYPYVQNSDPDIDELKKMKLYLYTVNTIRNSNANSTSTVYWKIYINMVDAETVIPVPFNGDYETTAEVQSASTGVISAPASVVSSIAHSLKDVPVIGPFALATSIGASAISSIARLFGFSRPRDFSKPAYPYSIALGVGIGELHVKPLTLDPKQEVTIDSSMLGESGDSLSYQNTICRKGLVQIFSWDQTDTIGTLLFQLPISPLFSVSDVEGGVEYFAPSPLAYSSQLFTAWRGSIDVHISIPANKFVRGKVRIYWDPKASSSSHALDIVSNNALSVLIDLTQTIDMTITVPWLSNNMYKPLGSFFSNLTTGASIDNRSNGYLNFVVEEPLVTNNSAWNADFIIYFSAGSDFELAYPSIQGIENVTFGLIDPSKPPFYQIPAASTTLTVGSDQQPLLNSWMEYTSAAESNNVNPSMSTSINLSPGDTNDKAAIIHMGESIPSLRLLLKRFYPLMNYPSQTVTTSSFNGPFLPYYPPVPLGPNNGTNTLIPPYLNNPITYLSKMFGGMRGSTRYYVNTPYGATAREVSVGRFYGLFGRYYQVPDTVNTLRILNEHVPGGLASFKPSGEPILVDIPYQNYHWFYPTTNTEYLTSVSQYGAWLFGGPSSGSSSGNFQLHYSTGEDFQFVIYNGPPIITKFVPVVG